MNGQGYTMSSITNLNQGNAVVNEHGTSKHAKTDGWTSRDTVRVLKGADDIQRNRVAGASSAASGSLLS